jgi:hypothetical protein
MAQEYMYLIEIHDLHGKEQLTIYKQKAGE